MVADLLWVATGGSIVASQVSEIGASLPLPRVAATVCFLITERALSLHAPLPPLADAGRVVNWVKSRNSLRVSQRPVKSRLLAPMRLDRFAARLWDGRAGLLILKGCNSHDLRRRRGEDLGPRSCALGVAGRCVHRIEMSPCVPFRNVTVVGVGRRAGAEPPASRSARPAPVTRTGETAPAFVPSGRSTLGS